MMDIVGKRLWFFLISAAILIPGLISLAIFRLEPGVDFSSGTTMTLRFATEIDQSQLRAKMASLGYGEATIQRTGDGDFLVRIKEISHETREELVNGLKAGLNTEITVRDSYTVSPVIATKIGRDAAIAVAVASILMMLYIAWAFRRMPKPFRWGTVAVIALVHDVLVVMGVFSILGWAAGVQIDAMFITGMLTVVGYSVNNIVVVFDRIRENVSKGISRDFEVTVNSSILETMGRCINTSLTTLFVILAMFLLGGATIHYFILVLLIGVIAGTYNSICLAGQLLVVWDKRDWGRLFPQRKQVETST